MSITWNKRLIKTAGFCAYNKRVATPSDRNVRIELSVKVCDTAGVCYHYQISSMVSSRNILHNIVSWCLVWLTCSQKTTGPSSLSYGCD